MDTQHPDLHPLFAEHLTTLMARTDKALLRGGLCRRAASGRLSRTRRITSIREEVRLNSQLWDLATEWLAA